MQGALTHSELLHAGGFRGVRLATHIRLMCRCIHGVHVASQEVNVGT